MRKSDKSMEILLVDDNPADVRLMREAFREIRLNSTLRVAADGIEAMAYLRHEGDYASMPRPDIVLLDLNLPRKNGHEVLAEIRRDPSLRLIPVVVLTTSSSPDDIQRSYDLQANRYRALHRRGQNHRRALTQASQPVRQPSWLRCLICCLADYSALLRAVCNPCLSRCSSLR